MRHEKPQQKMLGLMDDLQKVEKSPADSWLQTVCVANKFSDIFLGRFQVPNSPPKKWQVSYRLKKQPNCCTVIHHCCKATESPQPSQPDPSNVLDPDVLGAADDVASS